jgi:hypothetical protein
MRRPALAPRLIALTLGLALALLVAWRAWPRDAPITLRRLRPKPDDSLGLPVGPALLPLRPRSFEASAFDAGPKRYPPSTLRRPQFTPEELQAMIAGDRRNEVDEQSFYRKIPRLVWTADWPEHPAGHWTMRTNLDGFRNDRELCLEPDLRVIVLGDSHADGVCENGETFCALSERELRRQRPEQELELLNAAVGGYNLYHYWGAIERLQVYQPDAFVVAVYGGNDFLDSLAMYHRLQGTPMPPSFERYGKQIDRAGKLHLPFLAQAGLSLKFFATYPEQMELAAQAARELLTEMWAVSARAGAKLVLVYLPSLPDVQAARGGEELEQAFAALELDPRQRDSTDRLADALLDWARESGVTALDLRPDFRSADALLYWRSDHHVNLEGHARIAARLAPLLAEQLPAARRGVRSVGRPLWERPETSPEPERDPSEAPAVLSDDPLGRRPLPTEAVNVLFRQGPEHCPDPLSYYRYRSDLELTLSDPLGEQGPWLLRTDALGLRCAALPAVSAEPAAARTRKLRLLVLGDGRLGGALEAERSLCEVASRVLAERAGAGAVEILDGTCGGYSFYNYLGALERLGPLRPNVVLVGIDLASDFQETLAPARALLRPPDLPDTPPELPELSRLRQEDPALAFALEGLALFQQEPILGWHALRVGVSACLELAALCRRLECEPIFALVPPPLWLDRERLEPRARELLGGAAPPGGEQGPTWVQEAVWTAFAEQLAARGLAVVDLREVLAGTERSTVGLNAQDQQRLGTWLAQALGARIETSR